MRRFAVVAALAVGLGACESRPDLECPEGQVHLPFTVGAWDGEDRLEGVRVCVFGDPDTQCAETSARGHWDACVPAGTDVAFTFEKVGFISLIYAVRLPASGRIPSRTADVDLFDTDFGCKNWQNAGVTCPPPDQALAWLMLVDPRTKRLRPPGPAGVSAAFTPAVEKVFYRTGDRVFDPAATATSSGSPDIFAAGLAEGEAQRVVLSTPGGGTCRQIDHGWAAEGGGLRVPARRGFRTFVAALCDD